MRGVYIRIQKLIRYSLLALLLQVASSSQDRLSCPTEECVTVARDAIVLHEECTSILHRNGSSMITKYTSWLVKSHTCNYLKPELTCLGPYYILHLCPSSYYFAIAFIAPMSMNYHYWKSSQNHYSLGSLLQIRPQLCTDYVASSAKLHGSVSVRILHQTI